MFWGLGQWGPGRFSLYEMYERLCYVLAGIVAGGGAGERTEQEGVNEGEGGAD